MNKKAFFKIGIFGFVLVALIITIFLIININSTKALELRSNYLINDKLRLDLDNGIEKIKIQTPTQTNMIRAEKNLAIKLNELGKYKITFYGEDIKEYEFNVVSNLSNVNVDELSGDFNESNVDFNELNDSSNVSINRAHFTNTSTNFSHSSRWSNEIRVGEKVKWKKEVSTEKELDEILANVSEFAENISYNSSDLIDNGTIELSFETPAPEKKEKEISELSKEVEIYSEFHYENVTAFTNINEVTSDKSNILVYWEEENKYLDFDVYDLNNNSLIDYIEWIVPHLSNQTFQVIIVTNAEHLDQNRIFISDIYGQIKSLDGIYSETINDGEYVRIKFERKLTSRNDISILPRIVSGNPRIEIYEFNSSNKVSEFSFLNNEQMNKIYLFDLIGSQDIFDLKVIDGKVEFDYIVDPTPSVPREGLFAYGEGTVAIPRYRIWNGTGWSGENNASSTGANIEWVDVASSSTREEYALVVVNSTDGISIQLYNETEPGEGCWGNGTACGNVLYLASSTTANQQKADVEYESVSGHALVVYSDNTNTPKFRTWNGTTWSAQLAINDTSVSNIGSLAITGTKETIRLAASPNNGDEIALAISDSNDDSESVIWNGTGWNCESPVLSMSLGTSQLKKLEMAYEQVSGDLIIVSIVTTTAINITQKPSGTCSFTSIRQAVTDSERIDVSEQIGSDRIMIAGSTGGATDDMNAGIWNGSAYVNASAEDTTIYASETPPNRVFSTGWAGRKNGIVAYSDSAGTSVDWFFYNQTSTTWTTVTTDFAPTPAFGGAESNIKAFSFPDENKSFVFIKEDASADLWAKIYNGDSNSWSNTEGGATLEGSSSSTDFPSFDFGWLKYIDPLRVNIISPVNNQNYSNSTVYFNLSLNNGGIFCNYSLNGGITNLTMQRVSSRNFNATNLSVNDGNYLVRFYCFDGYGNSNITTSINFTVDDTLPTINFTNPTETNNSYLTRRYILVNVSANDSTMGVRNITIYLYNSSNALINFTTNSTSNISYYNFSVNSDGLYYFNASATDRVNNTNRTELRQVTIDTTVPGVNIISPVNNQNYSSLPIVFNISTSENSTALFTLNGGVNNHTLTKNASGTGFNFSNSTISDGNYLVRFYVNDSAGNRNYTSFSNFTVDITNPQITYGNGVENNGVNLSRNWIYVNVSVTEINEANITFVLYNTTGLVNSSTYTDKRRTINFTSLSDGTYYYNVSVRDSVNRTNATQTYSISLDNSAPTINFTNPTTTNNSLLTERNILVNITSSDLFLSNITIYIYNSTHALINSTINFTSNVLYYNFSVNSDGLYYFNATATDGINNRNSTERRQVTIDTSSPQVTVISPINNQNYSSLPIIFNISTNENSSALFTLDGGINNYSMTRNASWTGFNFSNSTINDGNYLVRFYVNDSAGNRNYTSTSNFTIDSTPPIINIVSPLNNTEQNSSNVLFNFSIVDFSSISSIIFYFNSTNYSYSEPVVFELADGNYTLFVYSNDSLGNLNYHSINFSVNRIPSIAFYNSSGFGIIGNTTVVNSYNGLYDLSLRLDGLNNTLLIYGFNKSGNESMIYSNYTNDGFGNDRFAISFEGMIFSHANISLNASGTHLYKCSDWNMTSLTCLNPDFWDVVSINTLGSLFNLTLNSSDPGFLQLTLANSENLDDGYASEAASATEYGARTLMVLSNSSSANNHPMVSFNVSRIPLGVVIDSANLTVRCSAETLEASESIGVGAHLVYSSYVWTEGTGGAGGNACAAGELCWNNRPSGAQYNNTPDFTLSIPDGCAGINYTFDVKNSLSYAYSQNYRNVSFYLVPTGSNVGTVTGDEIRLSTKEATPTNVRPKLNITYHSVPQVNVILPIDGTNYNYSQTIELRINASDVLVNISSAIANITLPNGTSELFVMSNVSFQIYQYNYTTSNLLGKYNITFIVNNTDNYINSSESTSFNLVDSLLPQISFVNPTTDSSSFKYEILINTSASDANFANLTTRLFSSSFVLLNLSISSNGLLYLNFSNLTDGLYYFNSTACDSSNNCNFTETREVNVDRTYPILNITYPLEGSSYFDIAELNYTLIEQNPQSCWYSLNEGNTNNTINCGENVSGLISNEGINNWIIYVNDSAGNMNFSEVTFFKDGYFPSLRFESPTPINHFNSSLDFVILNATINETNVREIIYNWNGSNFTIYNSSLSLYMNLDNNTLLNENESNVVDNSIYGNKGTFFGNTLWNSSGKYDYGAEFDGTNDWIKINDHDSLDGTQFFTYESWVYDRGNDALARGIISKRVSSGDTTNYAFAIFLFTNRYIYFDIAGSGDRHNSATALTANQWNHIVVTFDGTAPVGERKKFYINGVLVQTTASAQTSIPNRNSNLTIGILNEAYGTSWSGMIDEIKIWNKTLSEQEVYQSYAGNLKKFDESTWYYYVNQSYNSTMGLVSGAYDYSLYVKDVLGNQNMTENRRLNIDRIYPLINITYPFNGTNTSMNNLNINYTLIEQNPQNCFWNDNSGENNSIFCGNNISGEIWSEGGHLIEIYVNDSAGNMNSSNIYFFVDSIYPNIDFVSPTRENGTITSKRYILVNISANDLNFKNITIYLFNSTHNLINSTSGTASPLYYNFSVNEDGVYYLNASAIDLTNNINSTQTRQITLDNNPPIVNIILPINNQTYSILPIYFNISTNKVSSANYTLDNGITNITMSANVTGTGFNASNNSLADGNYLVRFYVVDSSENVNDTVISNFTIDTTNPQITYGNGVENNGVNLSRNWIYVNVSVTEINEANITFVLYNTTGLVNSSTYTDKRRTINWTSLSDEVYHYNVTVTDIVSRINTTENYEITLDSTVPLVNFTNPTEVNASEFERDFIYVNVSVEENNFANITFLFYNLSGIVNLTEYNSSIYEINITNLSSENVTYYYNVSVVDTFGNFNRTETRQIKLIDITPPNLILSEPINKTYYSNTSLPLTFSADDLHLSECWYNLDNEANISLPGCTGTIFDVSEGSHLLNLYANDTLGLVSNSSIYFVGNESLLPKRNGILVYGEGNAAPAPVRYRVWDGTSFSGENNAGSDGALPQWIVVKNSPSRDEQIIVIGNSLNDVNVRINGTLSNGTSCWNNGTTCGYYLNLTQTSTTVARQKVDVDYETYGGEAIIVYSQNNATLAYKVWNGTGWGVTLGLPQTLINSGVISYVNLVNNPFNDEIALIFTNTSALGAIIWNGTGWGCQPTNLLSTTMSTGVWQHADIAYEQTSGDLFIANTHSTQTEINYTTKASGSCTYNTFGTSTINMLEQGEIISVGARYGSDHIMITQEDTSGAANSEDLESIIWNGSTLINLSGNEITAYTATSPNMPIAQAWAGTSNHGIAVYSDAATSTNIDYFRYNISNQIWEGAAVGLNAIGPTNFSIQEQNMKGYSFIERNRSMLIFKDDNDDLWAKFYDGDTNTFGNLDGGTAFDTTVSSTNSQAFDFEFNYDRAGPDMLIRSPFGYSNTSNVLLNISTLENSISCVYSIDGSLNVSLSSLTPKSFYASPSVADGEHTVIYTCEDKWENSRSALQNFTVDTTLPLISFNSGTEDNASELQQNYIFVNVTLIEDNFENITYELRNSTSLVNRTVYNITITNITWYNLTGGLYYFNVSVYDYAGNFNRTETRTFNLTRNTPIVSLIYPNNGSNFTGYYISQFNFSVTGNATIDNCSLMGTWSTGWHINQTIFDPTLNQELNFSSVNVSNDGYYSWNVYCTDNLNVLGYNFTNFTFSAFLPTDGPILINISQTSNDGKGNVTLFWNQSSHAYLYKIYYSDSLNQGFVLLNITNRTNYTDTGFRNNMRRFYRVSAWNSVSENYSLDYYGAHVYTLSHTTNTRNWVGFPSNSTLLRNATSALIEIRNATAFTMWNASLQKRVTCNNYSCPNFPSCTDGNCNFNIIPGAGYEVNINSSAPNNINWSLVGIVYTAQNIGLIKNSTSFGKNWIALYANTTLTNAQTLYGNVTGADAVSRWNASVQTSQGIVKNPLPIGPAYLGNNFVLNMETGYEVSVNQTSSLNQI